jgi:hypothetical protein
MWLILIVTGFVLLFFMFYTKEGFAYKRNPCGGFDNCRSCAAQPGCGWCPDLGQCQPMAQDGFPIRTPDLTNGNPMDSPYIAEGVVPVISECPTTCKQSDLGDCDCSVMNRSGSDDCQPNCYAVYGRGCVCPNTQEENTIGSAYIKNEREIVRRLAKVTDRINTLLKTTRIHICSPHTFIIDSGRC